MVTYLHVLDVAVVRVLPARQRQQRELLCGININDIQITSEHRIAEKPVPGLDRSRHRLQPTNTHTEIVINAAFGGVERAEGPHISDAL